MKNNTNDDGQQPFESLNIPVGTPLTVETISPNRRLQAKLIGYVPGKSILISPPIKEGKETLLELDESVTIRLLIRKKICAFESRIKYRSLQPFNYYHLQYPTELMSLEVRVSERIDVSLNVLINSEFDIGVGEWPKSATITNLSKSGSALLCSNSLGEKGHEIIVNLDIEVSGLQRSLAINSVIRNKEASDADDNMFNYGLEFVDLTDADILSLTGFIYENT